MPTPSRLRELRATAAKPATPNTPAVPARPDSETFVFCTRCYKITVKAELKASASEPLKIWFKAEAHRNQPANCRCDETGWVQFVKETSWEFDNDHTPRGEKIVGPRVPTKTPARGTTGQPGDPGWDNHIWYGQQKDTPRMSIRDTPGIGMSRVTSGVNRGARRKQFVTRFVCRNRTGKPPKSQDGTHEFQLRWNLYYHDRNEWSKLTLSGNTPKALPNANARCP